jgi:hypothetical protein
MADIKYEDIDWTGSNFASAGCALEKVSISVGKIIGGGVSFVKGRKDVPIYLVRGGPYFQEIHFARNISVVLYDTRDRRAWLVDGASALLHLTRSQLSSSPYCHSNLFKLEDFHHADSKQGCFAAQKALTDPRNMEIPIFEDVEILSEKTTSMRDDGTSHLPDGRENLKRITRKWCFQDLVRQTYHVLELIHDNQVKALTSPMVPIKFTDREKLEGFGFMDIVSGQNDLIPRVATIKRSGRGWVDFTRSIYAITLLGRGFGELIKPAADANDLCKSWKQVPKGKDYLVACVSILKDICTRFGDRDASPLELAKGVCWHKADKLFESCTCIYGREQSCDRIQVLLPPFLGRKSHVNPFGEPRGAVIFGRSRRFCWSWPHYGDPVEGNLSEHETDNEIPMPDSGIGTSISASPPETSRSGDSRTPYDLQGDNRDNSESHSQEITSECLREEDRDQGTDRVLLEPADHLLSSSNIDFAEDAVIASVTRPRYALEAETSAAEDLANKFKCDISYRAAVSQAAAGIQDSDSRPFNSTIFQKQSHDIDSSGLPQKRNISTEKRTWDRMKDKVSPIFSRKRYKQESPLQAQTYHQPNRDEDSNEEYS